MTREELTSSERERRASFVHKLVEAGWDARGWESLFEGGVDLTPEAQAEYENEASFLRLGYFVREGAVLLECQHQEDGAVASVRFPLGEALEPLLDAVLALQDALSPEALPAVTVALIPLCAGVPVIA